MARPQIVGTVVDHILRAIADGTWSADSQLPSARQLGLDLAVSKDTVGVALQRLAQEGLLETRQRAPAKLRPDAAERARQLLTSSAPTARSRKLAILIADNYWPLTGNIFYFTLVGNLMREAERQGLRATQIYWSAREQLAVAESLPRTGHDAAVFVGFRSEYTAAVFAMHERRFPLLVYNYETPGLKLATVIEDLYGAAQKMADCLVKLGHHNLCLVAKPISEVELLKSHRGIGRGWVDYLADHNLLDTCTMPVYVPWEYRRDIFNQTFWTTLQGPNRPTALVFPNSFFASHFLSQPEASRLRVPEQLSLATFGIMAGEAASSWCPPLTNIEISHARTAQCIVETVRKMLDGEPTPPPIRMPFKLEVTESIGPPP